MTPNKLVETTIAKIDTSHCTFVLPANAATVDKKNPNLLYLNWRDCDKLIALIPPNSGLRVYEKFTGGESVGLEQKINYPDPESPIPGFLGIFGNNNPRRFIINDYGVEITLEGLFPKVDLHRIDMHNLYTLPTQVLNVILRRYITSLTPKARALVWDWSSIGSIISYKEAKEVYDDL